MEWYELFPGHYFLDLGPKALIDVHVDARGNNAFHPIALMRPAGTISNSLLYKECATLDEAKKVCEEEYKKLNEHR